MIEVTPEQITSFTLKSHFLTERKENPLPEVVSNICGLNAQSARASYISLWSRVKGFQKTGLDRALYEDRLLIKAWLMRGTVHVIPCHDYTIYQKALGGGLAGDWKLTLQKRGLGLSAQARAKLGEKTVDILTQASLTKKELLPRIKHLAGGFSEREQKIILSRTLRGLSYEGLVCHARPTGSWYHFKENRFVSVSRWLGGRKVKHIDERDAQRQLALRYISTYGPVTAADFAYWTGFKVSDAKRIFEDIAEKLVEVNVKDTKGIYWIISDKADALASIRHSTPYPVRFLPEFDPLVMGHKDKARILDDRYRKHIFLRLADVAPVFLAGGRIAGTWSYKFSDKSHDLNTFEKMGKKEKESVEREFERLREFLGKD